MYYNGNNYYFFSGVKNVFRKMLKDQEIDNDEIIFALRAKGFPFKTISSKRNGVDKAIGIYNKNIINSYFTSEDGADEIKDLIERYRSNDVDSLVAGITTRKNYKPSSYDKSYSQINQEARNNNKERMIAYLNSLDENPEEDMNKMSKRLLYDDDIIYESKDEDLSDVDTKWKPKDGIFLSKSPKAIANYLINNSDSKGQAMKRLTFYMNRAGENLTNKTVLNKVKALLRSDDE